MKPMIRAISDFYNDHGVKPKIIVMCVLAIIALDGWGTIANLVQRDSYLDDCVWYQSRQRDMIGSGPKFRADICRRVVEENPKLLEFYRSMRQSAERYAR
jgi:hypothetical protein